jgi:hypothetical protein
MSETFKMLNASLTTETSNVYVCPANTTAIFILGQVANADGANSADMTIMATDSSNTSTKFLAKTIPVPADAATSFLTGKLVLEAGDYLSANASSNSHLDVTVSVLEIS